MNAEHRKKTVQKLTSYIMHKHYCENDSEAIIALFDASFSWFGTGEQEYALGKDTVASIFRQFQGLVPKCIISEEEYDVIEATSDIYICSGRVWITTDPSTNMYLQVHQRITAVFRFYEEKVTCCHIHISNPYMEMTADDVGFPNQMGQQSYEYLQKCIQDQKKMIEEQTSMLERMSYEDAMTGLYNRNKFDQTADHYQGEGKTHLGIACIDLNGLKTINDQQGHRAGDDMLCRTAYHLKQHFPNKAYRIGGDELVIIDEVSDESAFVEAIMAARKGMEADQISVSVGICWRPSDCDIREQFDVADQLMYEEKVRYYSVHGHDRRRRRNDR